MFFTVVSRGSRCSKVFRYSTIYVIDLIIILTLIETLILGLVIRLIDSGSYLLEGVGKAFKVF